MKLRYWVAIALAVVAAVIIAGGAVLLETQAGLRWALGVAESHSGGTIAVGSASGTLAGPFTLENLRVTLSGAVITVKQARVDWKPSALAAGKLDVTALHAADVDIEQRAEKKATPFRLPQKVDLPLHITIESAQFEDIRVHTSTQALQLERIAFALDAGNRRILLDRFEARGPRIALGGRLRLEAHGEWPLTVRLAEILRPPGYPAVEGRTRLDGALRGTIKLRQTLHAPFAATLRATITTPLKTARVYGRLHIARLDPHAIKPTWPALRAAGELEFSGTVNSFDARGKVTLAGEKIHGVKFALEGGIARHRLHIASANLALTRTPVRLSLHGSIGLDAPHRAELELAWRDLHWPLTAAAPELRLAAGGAWLAGNLDDWTIHALTLLQTKALPRGRWALAMHGDGKAIAITGLAGRWLGGRITGQGRLELEGRRGFRITAQTHGLNPGAIAKNLHGRLGFNLNAGGELEPLHARARVTELAGQLNGHPLSGEADLDWTKNLVQIRKLSLSAGPNHFAAKGRWGKALDLDWRIRAPRLAALGEDFGGQLDARGRLSGSPDKPRVRAQIQGDKLRWRDVSIAAARAKLNVNLGAEAASTLAVHLHEVARGSLAFDTVALTLSGPAAAQHFELAMKGNPGSFTLAGTGRLDNKVWRGKLAAGSLHPAKAPTFTLQEPATLVLGAQKVQLGRSCWRAPRNAQFCLAAASGSGSWQATLDLDRLPLALADPYLTQEAKLHGALNGKLKASGGNGKLALALKLRANAAGISRLIDGERQNVTFAHAALTAQVNEATATARLELEPASGGSLEADVKIPWRAHAEPAGRIHLVAHIPDLAGFGALSNAISGVAGRLDADFTVSGNLAAPNFRGDARLSGAAVTLNRFGTHIENSNLDLVGEGSGLRLTGELADGKGGHLGLRGSLDRRSSAWALNLHVTGKNFRATEVPEAQVKVSPDLDIGLADHKLHIEGSLAIPSARIRPPHFSQAITPSPDLVIVGAPEEKSALPLKFAAHIAIVLGEDVHFDGYGLTARIGGKLALDEEPGKLTTASGELRVLDGHYKAYGQDLTIRHGRLLFSGGPIANPGLDIRATRQVGQVTAGLNVTGTLRNPKLRVFSNPPMPQSEALAYLLFGHGVQQNSGGENTLYQQAASAIGLIGGTYAVRSITQPLGIDTVSVENASRYSNDSRQASLFLGKYLSPRLYVSYGIGLYEPINLLRLRYTLSRHWALEAESGSISGADILFNIER